MTKKKSTPRYANRVTSDSIKGTEIVTGVSQTVPDQALSVQQILQRFTRGQPLNTFEEVYNGEEHLPDIDRMTEIDRIEYARAIKADLEETGKKLTQRQKERALEKAKAEEAKMKAANPQAEDFKEPEEPATK